MKYETDSRPGRSRTKAIPIIPARGGSKRFPRKNLASFGGKPLVVLAVEGALEAGLFERVLVSTDDAEIAEVAARAGAEIHQRRAELASDEAVLVSVVQDVLASCRARGVEFDTFCLLQPVCPLRTPSDICKSYELLEDRSASFVISVTELEDPPQWALVEADNGFLRPLFELDPLAGRLGIRAALKHNGAIIWARTAAFEAQRRLLGASDAAPYYMPSERSVEIDRPLDLKLAELLRAERPIAPKPG